MLSFRTALPKQLIGSYRANDRCPPLDPEAHDNGHWPRPKGVKLNIVKIVLPKERDMNHHTTVCFAARLTEENLSTFVFACFQQYHEKK